jgi:hypothetical protein
MIDASSFFDFNLSSLDEIDILRSFSPNLLNWDKKVPHIHYSELGATKERVVFGQQDDCLIYNYDDRLAGWNYEKWKSSREKTTQEIDETLRGTPRYWQEVLRKFWDDQNLELGCIITAVNQSNGFQYLVFGCKHSKKPKVEK